MTNRSAAVTVGAFGAAIAIGDGDRDDDRWPDGLGAAIVAALVERTVLDVVQQQPDARWQFRSTDAGATADCWRGDELLRRHIVSDPVDLVDLIVGSTHHAIAMNARHHVFIHAAVVAVDGLAVVLPGSSRAGKSTLVRSLQLAGATYLSDEYAVLAADGSIHGYYKPLSIRTAGGTGSRIGEQVTLVDPESLGSVYRRSIPAGGLAIVTEYAADLVVERSTSWQPMSPGSLALALLQHCVSVRASPVAAISAITEYVRSVSGLVGPRGDADQAAARIMEIARAQVAD